MINRRMLVALGAAVSATLGTASCTSSPPPVPASPEPEVEPTSTAVHRPEPAEMPVEWADGRPVVLVRLDLASAGVAAIGTDVEVVAEMPAATANEARLSPLALLPDGSVVASEVPADVYDGGEWLLAGSRTGLWDGQVFEAFDDSASLLTDPHPRQTYAAATDGTVVAWAETTSTNLYESSWRMFSRDAEGLSHLVATSEQVNVDGLPLIDGDATPVIYQGRVYWATSYPLTANPTSEPSSWDVTVVSAPIDGSEGPRVEATRASRPSAGADGVFAVKPTEESPFVPGEFGVVALLGPDGPNDVLRTSPEWGGHIAGLAAGSHLIATVLVSPDHSVALAVADEESDEILLVPLDSPTIPDVAVCGDRVVWTSADPSGADMEPVYSLRADTRSLTATDVEGNYGPVDCAGDFISWSVIDTDAGSLARGVVARWL